MAASSYDAALARLLAHEGGYANHPSDPGGPTKFGITLAVYRRYAKPDAKAADVKAMRAEEAKTIYRRHYWDALRCDELPAGVDCAVFDYGVNSGVGRAAKVLQRVCGVKDDGVLGPLTMAAVARQESKALIHAICDERLRFLRSLKTWRVFGRGWGRRVDEVRAAALAMAIAVGRTQARSVLAADAGRSAAGGAVAAALAHQTGMAWQAVMLVALAGAAAISLALHFLSRKKGTDMWDTIKRWFKRSETIFWARLQVFAGAAMAVAMTLAADPTVNEAVHKILKPEYVPYYVIGAGLLTEMLRRRRATDL
jgi:lysozyme family protein